MLPWPDIARSGQDACLLMGSTVESPATELSRWPDVLLIIIVRVFYAPGRGPKNIPPHRAGFAAECCFQGSGLEHIRKTLLRLCETTLLSSRLARHLLCLLRC